MSMGGKITKETVLSVSWQGNAVQSFIDRGRHGALIKD